MLWVKTCAGGLTNLALAQSVFIKKDPVSQEPAVFAKYTRPGSGADDTYQTLMPIFKGTREECCAYIERLFALLEGKTP